MSADTTELSQGTNVREMTVEEGREMLDRQARRYLDMSGEAFLAAWREGRLPDPDRPEVMRVVLLIPFAEE